MGSANIQLDDKYRLSSGRAYLSGIEALVRLPMLQHQRDLNRGLNTAGFISGYRGSPLGGLDQALWQARPFLDPHHIVFRPGVNEDLAMTAVWGSQQVNLFAGAKYDGVFAMWYGKGPGLDRSMDVLKHANAFGTSKYGGVLAVVGDDHACKSSTLPHQSEHSFIAASAPVLAPANVQEVLDLGIMGWELSRYSGCWVGLKAITENMDSSISADIDPGRITIHLPDKFQMPEGGLHARWPDRPLEQEERLNRYKIYAAREFARVNNLNYVTHDSPAAKLGIITSGKAYLDVLQALDDLGIDEAKAAAIGLRVFKVGMPWPLEPVATHEFAKGLIEILVVEEKRSVIEDQLTGQLYNWPVHERPKVVGEYDEHGQVLLTNLGELTPAMVARAIAARLQPFYRSDEIERRLDFLRRKEQSLARPRELIERIPHYCSGCPHNTSTKVPEGSRAMAGIGCHYMVTWMNRRTDTFTQMGGEGATWLGQAPFTDTKHVFQNLGDGTYFHSGLLAIRAAVAAGVNITYKILYNDAVAMTGGQPLDGALSVAQLVMQLRDEGLERIAVVTDEPDKYPADFPRFSGLSIDHRRQLDAIQKELREVSGTTAIIYDQTCAAEKRRRRKQHQYPDPAKRVFINTAVCEGCGDCGVVSNCLSVLPRETELGRKRVIDQNACNKDYSCVDGFCPSFVTVHGGQLKKSASELQPAEFGDLPEPQLPALRQPWNIVMAGIGGTGVLTISSMLGMAAHLESKGCSVLNLTGLAQKFGAVVSHVRIGESQADIHAVRVPAGDAHLLLGCDLVVAAGAEALAKVNQEISHAVINDYESPTAEFTANPDARFPKVAMKKAISDEVGEEKCGFINASQLALDLMGDSIGANCLLLGYAWQRGLIPLKQESILGAIELNQVAVEFNKRAFAWGRVAAHDYPGLLQRLPSKGQEFSCLTEYEDILSWREEYLAQYQNRAYAQRYRQFVEACRERERSLDPDSSLEFSKAVAKSYFKLLAIKDEYEVARLFSDGSFKRQIEAQFEGDFELHFHLAAPLVAKRDRHTGKPLKREFGPWLMRLFGLLAKLKFLRHTALDIFGYSAERKLERNLLREFETLIETRVLPCLSRDNLAAATELVAAVEKIRGFGHIKEQSVAHWRSKHEQLLAQFEGTGESPVRIVELDKVS
ncbi:MAG: indolepyruvate ferredoxin oxidoreductase family protein [Gammaproteobacteria bacterium]|uniref:indolepyruvate ferredoxin oxidoreductase family protein n=1 Tax=Pseudomaricurvus alcaniphilus TaxID=1166482 RepID=UPI001408A602|nr:indolepyruvate ferredoxin oxidoreductase family protein [Pseudomaricurvus alcaniphilus]MBR9912898.1 indolepyruvate ferredoxin oxidoreductase family protein [Gammaproteobacteria bacterium]NHN38694.1 indolepyruvate ferredoxin oxidoreductase family protein [Pseudomaricurvus alcaniphilus]